MGRSTSILEPLARLHEGETVQSTNADFLRLLDEYYKSNNKDKRIAAELWRHIFRTSVATMIKKYNWMRWEQIEEWSIDNTMQLMKRIDNREKYPDGYRVETSVATLVWYGMQNIAKAHQVIEEKQKLELDYEDWLDYKASGFGLSYADWEEYKKGGEECGED